MIYRLFGRRPGRGHARRLQSARLLRCEILEQRQLLTAVGGTDDLPLLEPGVLMVPTEAPTAPLAPSSPVFGSPPVGGQPPFGATSQDTSEYMLGDVWVNVVLLESDGSIDAETEDWTQAEINAVKSELIEGAQWWEGLLPAGSNDLSFQLDFTYADNPVPTSYEPINRPSSDQDLWIGDFLDTVNHSSSGSIFTDMRQWDHDSRISNGTHWAYTVFVVDSSNDADGKFDNGAFGYAYLGGPFTVLTYDNDGWGIARMSHVFAHETGHVFYALDEYPDSGGVYTSRSGYYDTQNLNAYDGNPDLSSRVNSLMAEANSQIRAWDQHTSSPTSLEMIGWQDSDSDGIFDVLDVPLSLTGSGQANPDTAQYEFSGLSSVQTLANLNPYGTGHAITTNTVDRIQYRLDGGVWMDGNEYHDYSVSVAQNVPVPSGAHTIDFRTIVDQTGVTSPVWSDSFVLNGAQVIETDGATDISEAGGVDTYTISLGTTPSGNVEITVTADSQSEVSLDGVVFNSSVVFTRDDTAAQTITVRAIDDTLREGQHTSLITQAITASADPNYPTSLVLDSVVANVTDNDVGGVTIVESDGSTEIDEAGTIDSYTLALDTMPTATVVIGITADSQTEVSIDGVAFSSAVSFAAAGTSPQTVFVKAIDDAIVEGFHSSRITHSILSSDAPNYPTAVPIASVIATITDNDVADVTIVESDGSTILSEEGTLDTYTIGLISVPTGAVNIAVGTDGQSELSLDGTTFRTSLTVRLDDMTPRTITVRAVDDPFAEGPHISMITHDVASSADPNYLSMDIPSITAQIMDDDTAGITVTESDGSTNVSEAGGIDSYTVSLDTPPLSSIAIRVSGDPQTEVSLNGTLFRPNISFSRDSINPQTIWVRAVDDQATEGPHVGVVTHSLIFTDDPAYPMSLPIDDVLVQIADNDAAGVTVIESAGSTAIGEAGTLDTYTMALDSPPTGPVEITVTADSQAEVSIDGTTFSSHVSFTRSDTSPRTITVRAVDDLVDEGVHTTLISHAITASNDPSYPTTLPIASLIATITDDDTAGVTVTETGGSTLISEAGTVDQYDIALDTLPVGPVELTVTADPQTEVSLDGITFSSTLTFTRSDTSPRTITVRAVDDLVNEGDHVSQITQAITASNDPNYPTTTAIASVVAQIEDNDQAGVTIVESDGATALSEAGNVDTYTIALDTPPAGEVEFQVTTDGQTEVSLDGTTFSNSVIFLRNDTTFQTITVRAIDDAVSEGVHASTVSHSILTSTAPDYPTTLPLPPVMARIVDNELAGVTVTEAADGTAIFESGIVGSYTVALDVPPETPIEITVTADSQSEVSLDGITFDAAVSFSRSDTTLQTITVHAIDDLIDEGPHTSLITHAVTASNDPNFPTTLTIADVVADITDNDAAGVTVTETGSGTVIGEEGQTDSYSIALDTQPEGAVEVTVTADDQSEVSLDGTTFSSTVTFTRSDTAAQTITVRAIDDTIDEGPHSSVITHAVTASGDPKYSTDLFIASVTADVTDNERIGIRVKESDGATEISEAGSVDSYTIALDVAPSGSVAISVRADAQSEVSLDGTNFRSSISFVRTSTAAQTITVRAIDDAAIEGPHTSQIRNSIIFSNDPNFPSGLAIPDVVAKITDNEVAGVIVVESDGGTDVTEGGNLDTYTLKLDTLPTGMVEISVTADNLSEVSLDGTTFASSLHFTPTDVATQTITVRAVDNQVVDGPRTGLITNTVTASNDPQFPTNLPIADVVVNVADNDVPGVTVTESDGGTAIDEAGTIDSYTVALDTRPATDVEITVTADGQSEVSLDGVTFSATVSFAPSDTTPQTVTVRAIDDAVIEGDHTSTITHTITASADPDYSADLPIASVVATVVDNDTRLLGDVNSDGQINGLDVGPFVNILLNGPYDPTADMNEDGAANGLDVDLFVAAVVGSNAPSLATTPVAPSGPVMGQPVVPVAKGMPSAPSLLAPAEQTTQRTTPLPSRSETRRQIARHAAARRAAVSRHMATTPWEVAVDDALAADVDWTS